MPILEINEVSKSFGGLMAVKDVSLTIERGEIIGLIGPNGAGKTTLFNVIAGVYKPDGGSIVYKGNRIDGLKPHQVCRRGIARTYQVVKPFGLMTVLENAMVGAFCRVNSPSQAREIAAEKIDLVGLTPKRDMIAYDLTLGNRKRLELARALAAEPELLLLDEVMAGSNPKETMELLALLRKVREQGVTLFIVEHVMKAVMGISDRVVLLHHGEKIVEGRPQDVVSDERAIKAYLGERYAAARTD